MLRKWELVQLSLTDYLVIEKTDAWQMPLHEYLELPKSQELPKDTLLNIDLSQETPESLTRFKNIQLEALCMFWKTAISGAKAKKIENLLNTYKAYQTIA